MPSMICPECKHPLPDNAIICPYCGLRLNQKGPVKGPDRPPVPGLEDPEPRPDKPRKKIPLPLILVAAVVLIGLSILGNGLRGSSGKGSAASASVPVASSIVQASSASVQDTAGEVLPAGSAAAAGSETASSASEEALDPNGCYQQIFVETSGSSAELSLMTYRNGAWVEELSTTAAIGSNGITYNKTEGDHATPAGTFPLGFVFSTYDQDTRMPFVQIHEDSVWVCEPDSSFYNTLQSQNDPSRDWPDDKSSFEKMYVKFSKKSSTACIYFEFNGDGLTQYSAGNYNGGSALFLDGVGANGNMNSGYGDIKISASDMKQLLKLLDPALNPTITIE